MLIPFPIKILTFSLIVIQKQQQFYLESENTLLQHTAQQLQAAVILENHGYDNPAICK